MLSGGFSGLREFGFEKPLLITDAWGCWWNHSQRIGQEPSDFVGVGWDALDQLLFARPFELFQEGNRNLGRKAAPSTHSFNCLPQSPFARLQMYAQMAGNEQRHSLLQEHRPNTSHSPAPARHGGGGPFWGLKSDQPLDSALPQLSFANLGPPRQLTLQKWAFPPLTRESGTLWLASESLRLSCCQLLNQCWLFQILLM